MYLDPDLGEFVISLRPLAYAFVEPGYIHLFAGEDGTLHHLVRKWMEFALTHRANVWEHWEIRPTLIDRLAARATPWRRRRWWTRAILYLRRWRE